MVFPVTAWPKWLKVRSRATIPPPGGISSNPVICWPTARRCNTSQITSSSGSSGMDSWRLERMGWAGISGHDFNPVLVVQPEPVAPENSVTVLVLEPALRAANVLAQGAFVLKTGRLLNRSFRRQVRNGAAGLDPVEPEQLKTQVEQVRLAARRDAPAAHMHERVGAGVAPAVLPAANA